MEEEWYALPPASPLVASRMPCYCPVSSCTGYSSQWCNEHYVHAKGMKKAREVRQQLVDIMKMQKMHVSSSGTRCARCCGNVVLVSVIPLQCCRQLGCRAEDNLRVVFLQRGANQGVASPPSVVLFVLPQPAPLFLAGHRRVREHAERHAVSHAPFLCAVRAWLHTRLRDVPRYVPCHAGIFPCGSNLQSRCLPLTDLQS